MEGATTREFLPSVIAVPVTPYVIGTQGWFPNKNPDSGTDSQKLAKSV